MIILTTWDRKFHEDASIPKDNSQLGPLWSCCTTRDRSWDHFYVVEVSSSLSLFLSWSQTYWSEGDFQKQLNWSWFHTLLQMQSIECIYFKPCYNVYFFIFSIGATSIFHPLLFNELSDLSHAPKMLLLFCSSCKSSWPVESNTFSSLGLDSV